jgi:hypothetical protein
MRFDVRKLACLLLLMGPVAANAQLWSGPAAVEVRAEDSRGHAMAGAKVLLQYAALTPKDGPPAVETDSRGRANVAGLAEGPWHVEVSHDGFMTFMAEINVGRGRPETVQVTQFRVPNGGTSLMQVKIAKGTPGPAPVRAAAPPPAPRPEAVAPAPAAPVQQPVPERPGEQTVVLIDAPPAPPPPPSRPPTPGPAPVPVTPPPAAMPAPVPPPPAGPTETVRTRTAKDRTCVECQPGETAMSVEWVPSPGGGSCGGDIATRLKGGEVPSDLPPGCHVLKVALPAGMRFTAFRYEAQAGGYSFDCATGQPCSQDTGSWPIDPVLIRDPKGTVVLAPFENGAAQGDHRAVLTVYYTAGNGKR